METVGFDLGLAPRLADEMERAGLEVGAARTRLARLLEQACTPEPELVRRLDRAVEWGIVTAADLRWRLDYLAECQVFLPTVDLRSGKDGRVVADLPFRDRAEADRWARGARLHADLVAALAATDGRRADELFDELEALFGDPMALAGFAGALGATGLADLVERIDDARHRDPVNTASEFWHRGRNPRWDELDARLTAFADRAGGLASFGADDEVEIRFRGGGIQVVTMADLLRSAPADLAGNWSRDLDLTDQPVLLMGGAIATMRPLGPNVTGSGLLVPRIPDLPGSTFWWDDARGRLVTSTFEMPSTAELALQTAGQLVTHPVQSIEVAMSRPGDAARGFLYGAGLTAAIAAPFASVPLLSGGAAATGGQIAAVQAGIGAGSVAVEAADDGPCRGERVVFAAGGSLLGMGVSGAFAEGGRTLLSTATDLAGSVGYGVTPRC